MLSIFETAEINLSGSKDGGLGLFVDGMALSGGSAKALSVIYELTPLMDQAILNEFLDELSRGVKDYVGVAQKELSSSRAVTLYLSDGPERRLVIALSFIKDPSMQAVGKMGSAYIKNPLIFRIVRKISEVKIMTLRLLGLSALAESEGLSEQDTLLEMAREFEKGVLSRFSDFARIARVHDYQSYAAIVLQTLGLMKESQMVRALSVAEFEERQKHFKLNPMIMFGVLGQRYRISRFGLLAIDRSEKSKTGETIAKGTQLLSYVANGVHSTNFDVNLSMSSQVSGFYTKDGSLCQWAYRINSRALDGDGLALLTGASAWKTFRSFEKEDLSSLMKARRHEVWNLDDTQWLTNFFQIAPGAFNSYSPNLKTLPMIVHGEGILENEKPALEDEP